MIVYKVSVEISPARESEWLTWMQKVHIPEVMATGSFTSYEFLRSPAGLVYSIYYRCKDQDTYDEYQRIHAPDLQQKHTDLFKGDFKASRELLDVVEHLHWAYLI